MKWPKQWEAKALQPGAETKASTGCFMIFCIPFAAASVFFVGWIVRDFYRYRAMQSWVEVPATITHAELQTDQYTDKGHRVRTMYLALAKYEYLYNGRMYVGDRVSLVGGSQNVGSFHQDAYRELSQHHESHTPFRCYVNPSIPIRIDIPTGRPETSLPGMTNPVRWELSLSADTPGLDYRATFDVPVFQ